MKKNLLVISLFLALLTKCTVYNCSINQNADTLEKGTIRVGYGLGLGTEITYAPLLLDKEVLDTIAFIENSPTIAPFRLNHQVDIGIGIKNNFDLNVRIWKPMRGAGVRIAPKLRLTKRDQMFRVAIMPSISGMYVPYKEDDSGSSDYSILPENFTGAVELPVVFDLNISKAFSFYLGLSYSLYYLNIIKWFDEYFQKDYMLHRGGFHVGLSIKPEKFYIRPEYSYQIVKGPSGISVGSHCCGFGLGVEFPVFNQ